MDFFDAELQNSLKSRWSKPEEFSPNVFMNFNSYYGNKNDPAKSVTHKVGQFYVNPNFYWHMPKGSSALDIEVTVNPSTNSLKALDLETGFTLRMPPGVALDHLELDPREKGIFVPKNWFFSGGSDEPRVLPLEFRSKGKRRDAPFILTPHSGHVVSGERSNLGDELDHNLLKESSRVGWHALHVEVVDPYSLRVYLTDLPYRENIDFHNLVLDMKFSEPLSECNVGFWDKQGYFSEIAKGLEA